MTVPLSHHVSFQLCYIFRGIICNIYFRKWSPIFSEGPFNDGVLFIFDTDIKAKSDDQFELILSTVHVPSCTKKKPISRHSICKHCFRNLLGSKAIIKFAKNKHSWHGFLSSSPRSHKTFRFSALEVMQSKFLWPSNDKNEFFSRSESLKNEFFLRD